MLSSASPPGKWTTASRVPFRYSVLTGLTTQSSSIPVIADAQGNPLSGGGVAGTVVPEGGTVDGSVTWQYSGTWMRVVVTMTYPFGVASSSASCQYSPSGRLYTIPLGQEGLGITRPKRGWVSGNITAQRNWVYAVKVNTIVAVTVKLSGPKNLLFKNPRWSKRPK